jgi:hypothetical protein
LNELHAAMREFVAAVEAHVTGRGGAALVDPRRSERAVLDAARRSRALA